MRFLLPLPVNPEILRHTKSVIGISCIMTYRCHEIICSTIYQINGIKHLQIFGTQKKKKHNSSCCYSRDTGRTQSIGRCVYNNLFPQSNFRKDRCHFNDKILMIQRFHSTFS